MSELTVDDLAALDFSSMSLIEQLSVLPEEEHYDIISRMSADELKDPRVWLRPSQIRVLDDEAPVILDARGRGAGKTKTGGCWVVEKAEVPGTRIHLVGRTVADVRDVMVSGESGILASSKPSNMPVYTPSNRKLSWPNGSVAYTFSAEQPDQLRGPQSEFTWIDELAACKMKPDSSGATVWDNVLISTRLGANPQVLATTTPRRVKVIRDLIAQNKEDSSSVSLHVGSTMENASNLSPAYIKHVYDMYAGTALEQQELHGIMIDEVAGALWRETDFVYKKPSDFSLSTGDFVTVIGVDPSVTTGGDATGIVVVRGTIEPEMSERRVFVKADETEPGLSPDEWAKRIVDVWAREFTETGKAPIVVAEKNQGGLLIENAIKQTPGGKGIPVGLIHASISKKARAEPILLAYRRGRVFHEDPAMVDQLEAQMLEWEPDVKSGWSPDRIDAMVHAARSIMVEDSVLQRFGVVRITNSESGLTVPVSKARMERNTRRPGIISRFR